MDKKQLLNLVAQGSLQSAAESLREVNLSTDDAAFLATLTHNLAQGKQQYAARQINFAEFEKTQALVASGLTQLIGNLPDEQRGFFAGTNRKIAVLSLFAVVLIALWIIFSKSGTKPPVNDQMSTQGTQSPVIKGDNTHIEYNNDKKDQ